MKLATACILAFAGSAAAFTVPTMTFSIGKAATKAKQADKKAKSTAVALDKKAKSTAVALDKKAKSTAVALDKKAKSTAVSLDKKAKSTAKQAAKKVTFSVQKTAKQVKGKAAIADITAKKFVKKATGVGGGSPSADAWANSQKSIALPFAQAPGTLDGSLIGDFGFDPLGFSTVPVGPWFLGLQGRQGSIGNLNWYREAELIHGRISMLAVVGFIAPGLFGTLPGNDWTGPNAYSNTNPLEAFSQVPGLAILQIFLFMSFLEFRRIRIIQEEGASHMPGDLRIGQGPGRWNPFGLDYSPEQYAEKQLQELKHCRLAMIGIFGLWAQAQASGEGVVAQLSAGLTAPEYYAKSGYFFPEGI